MQGLKYLKVSILIDELEAQDWIAERARIVKSLDGVRRREFARLELLGFPFDLDPA